MLCIQLIAVILMNEKLLDDIYLSLQGSLLPETAVPWVPNLFKPYGYCEREYAKMRESYVRVCTRMGIDPDDEDEDLNRIVLALENIQEAYCKEMFRLGMEYAVFRGK